MKEVQKSTFPKSKNEEISQITSDFKKMILKMQNELTKDKVINQYSQIIAGTKKNIKNFTLKTQN